MGGREGAGKIRVMQVIIQVLDEMTGSWIWISRIHLLLPLGRDKLSIRLLKIF